MYIGMLQGWVMPYSRKRWREKTLANRAVATDVTMCYVTTSVWQKCMPC